MTIQDAIKSGKPFRLSILGEPIQYYLAGTGPFNDLVIGSAYFVIDGELVTSLNLYAYELLSNDWEIIE